MTEKIRLFKTEFPMQSLLNIDNVLRKGFVSEGEENNKFEQRLKEKFDFRNIFTVNSGTSALHMALILADVKAGQEVILPAQTFVSTGLAVLYCGAKPVFADINQYGLIDIDDIGRKLSHKTKAIIGVDWAGLPCDIYEIMRTYREPGCFIIEDAAQALGSKYNGKSIGQLADFTCLSFQATKTLTTGDGGAVVAYSEFYDELGRKLRWFGIDRKNNLPDETGERNYNLEELGYKYHLNDIAAAIGLGQLDTLDSKISIQQSIARYYDLLLKIKLPLLPYTYSSNYYVYSFMANERNLLIKTLAERNIESSILHHGIDRNKIFGGLDKTLVNQRKFEQHYIALPIGITTFQTEYICEIIKNHERKYGRFEWK